ncbi:MAG TPA: TFIIB-type zinc ribbon-containing protein [Candidatus Nitrosopolaris sp.]
MKTSIICSICNKKEGQAVTDPKSGEVICSNCGMVMVEAVSENRSEWRAFKTEEANQRSSTGTPTSLARHDMGLATIIGRTDKDASGRGLDASMRSTMERLRTWDSRIQVYSPADRNLRQAFGMLERVKDKLGLSATIIEKTAYIYRKAQERGLVRGRTIRSVMAAAIYITCREMAMSRTLNDVAFLNNIKRKELARTIRLLILELDIKIPILDPIKCVVRVANKVNLSEKTKRQAMAIMHNVTKSGISAGKDPMGLAGSVLYLSSKNSGENITQMDIAEAAGVTEVTIRNRFKDLRNRIDLN